MAKKEPEKEHSLLSPSAAGRWLFCTRSARFAENFPNKTSAAAEEGTLAHSLGELMIRTMLGRVSDKAFQDCLKNFKKQKLYSQEMYDCSNAYACFVVKQYEESKALTEDAEIEIEASLDLSMYIPECRGTGDAGIVGNRVLKVIDYKHGKGVKVNCVKNEQMMIYALGFLEIYDMAFDIDTVEMTIYQPRMNNISTWSIPVLELKKWAKEVLVPTAKLAFEGKGTFAPGPKCQFCPGKTRCKTLAIKNLDLVKHEFRDPDELLDQDFAEILPVLDMLVSWANSIQEYATEEAVGGRKFKGMKLVAGRGSRSFKDEAKVVEILLDEGYEESEVYNPRKLKSMTDIQTMLKKARFEELFADQLVRTDGKPTLVLASDPREEYNSDATAAAVFANINTN